MSRRLVACALTFSLALACQASSRPRPAQPAPYPPPGPPPPGGYQQYPPPGYPGAQPPGQYPQYSPAPQTQGYPPANTQPWPYPPQTGPGASPPTPHPPAPSALPVRDDPINDLNLGWLRQRSQSVMAELVAALTDAERARVQNIPLAVDTTPGDVNAFAACADGRALMAITDGMLEIMAWLAMSAAHDELFGTNTTDTYIRFIAENLREQQPLPRPANLFSSATRGDPRKVARQHVLLDEQIAFVLGHELAHHHLGHLPCTGQPGFLGSADLLRVAADRIPVINQPNEAAADLAGTSNVLNAGARRSGARWTEGGALLTMRFFKGLEGGGTVNLLLAFARSHPAPQWRVPLIQQSANYWRRTGGASIPIIRLGG